MKNNWISMIRDVLILWAAIHAAGYYFGTPGQALVVAACLLYALWIRRDLILSKFKGPTRPYRVRYNTKNDGARDFWRVIDDKGIEYAADKIECLACMETETLIVDGVLKGNVVILASDFRMSKGVAYFS